jgi:hypothetical protein
MTPEATYGRRDSRVTFDLPQPFAAMDACGVWNEDEMKRRWGMNAEEC